MSGRLKTESRDSKVLLNESLLTTHRRHRTGQTQIRNAVTRTG